MKETLDGWEELAVARICIHRDKYQGIHIHTHQPPPRVHVVELPLLRLDQAGKLSKVINKGAIALGTCACVCVALRCTAGHHYSNNKLWSWPTWVPFPSPSLSLSRYRYRYHHDLVHVLGHPEVRLFGITQRRGPLFVFEKKAAARYQTRLILLRIVKESFFPHLLATCRLIAASGCQHQPIFTRWSGCVSPGVWPRILVFVPLGLFGY